MVKPGELEKKTEKLIGLEEQELPSAREVFKEREEIKRVIKNGLEEGVILPEDSEYFAKFNEVNGRIPYKEIAEYLAEKYDCQDLLDELKEGYRNRKRKKLVYGRNSQPDLFSE